LEFANWKYVAEDPGVFTEHRLRILFDEEDYIFETETIGFRPLKEVEWIEVLTNHAEDVLAWLKPKIKLDVVQTQNGFRIHGCLRQE